MRALLVGASQLARRHRSPYPAQPAWSATWHSEQRSSGDLTLSERSHAPQAAVCPLPRGITTQRTFSNLGHLD